MFSNNYDPFDDFFGPSHFGTFSSPYEQRRRQELARRQKMEAERRRKAEFERRKLMELERAKEERRRELEMMRRQQQMMKEEETRREKLAQAQQQRRSTYSPGSIVLGPDGNLYRVISPTADDEQLRRGEERSPVDKKRFSASDESKDNSDEQMIHPEEESEPFHEESDSSESEECSIDDVCASHSHEDHFYDALDTHTDPATHTEVEVEDVPDEEDEELKELHSISRNRSPSPGQWMEPIE
eukprot:scaffold42675_cov183-Skeletonema_marinoi.AAC.2